MKWITYVVAAVLLTSNCSPDETKKLPPRQLLFVFRILRAQPTVDLFPVLPRVVNRIQVVSLEGHSPSTAGQNSFGPDPRGGSAHIPLRTSLMKVQSWPQDDGRVRVDLETEFFRVASQTDKLVEHHGPATRLVGIVTLGERVQLHWRDKEIDMPTWADVLVTEAKP